MVDEHAKHGPVFRYRYLGRRVVVLCEPEARQFLAEHGEQYFDRRAIFRPFLTEVGIDLFSGTRTAHHELKSALRLAFSAEVSRQFVGDIIEIVRRTVESWNEGQPLVVSDFVDGLLLRIFMRIAADCDVDDPHQPIARFTRGVIQVVTGVSHPISLRSPAYRRARRKTEALIDRVVTAHQGSDATRNDRLDVIDALTERADEDGSGLSQGQIRACLTYGLMGCLEYVRALVSTMLYQALKHPSLHEEVRREGAYMLAQDKYEGQDFRRMVNTRGLMLESLRVCPPLPGLPFEVTRGFEFAGHWIEPGQVALITPLPGHFDPAHYKNPLVFDSGRCQPPRNEHRGDAVYSPFGVNAHEHTRHCAAKGFTTVVSIATVASLLSSVELSLPAPDYEPKFVMTPTLGPDLSFSVVVGPRRTPVIPSSTPFQGISEKITDHLSDVSSGLLTEKLAEAERRSFEPDAVVFRQGDPSDGFYVLLEGHVEVLLDGRGGPKKQVASLGPGDYFGEIGLLKNVSRTATIKVSSGRGAETVFLDRSTFKDLVAETDLFSDELAHELHRRYLETNLATAIPELELEDLREMLAEFAIGEYAQGETIIRQDDPADTFHIICHGTVVVERKLPSGTVIDLARLSSGQFFGEIGILQGQRRGASVKADSELVKTMWIGRDDFSRLVMQSHGSRNRIARVMHERVMENFDRMRSRTRDRT